MRITMAAALALAVHTAGTAQVKPTPKPPQTQADADKAMKGIGKLPAGWKGRLDNPDVKPESVTVTNEGPSLKFTTGPDAAGIYYKSDMNQKGDYELSATFSQLKPSTQPEAYGLLIGGTDLDKPAAHYTYFVIRQDGKYSIASRNGDKTAAIVDWTDSAAMKDPKGTKTSNTLAVRAQGDEVHFLIGGKEVQKLTRAKADPAGIAGLRVSRDLNLQVDKLLMKPLPSVAR
jgi:hypothetical protein